MKNLLFILTFPFLLTSCNLSRTNYAVKSRSMLPTLNVDDHVKITEHFEGLIYGDLIVYAIDWKTEYYEINGPAISRIIGLPGDSVIIKNDTCIINGKKNQLLFIRKDISNRELDEVDRQYIEEYEEILPNNIKIHIFILPSESLSKNMEAIKIPEGHYFIMGDFRGLSMDSRHFGPISKDQIIGKIIKITQKKK